MSFELKFMPKSQVESHIEGCEGRHIQQVSYSTYHNALTQICFNCEVIRTSLPENHIYRGGRQKWKDKTKVSPISASATERNDKKGKAHPSLKITTKGFDCYKQIGTDGEEWFNLSEIMSKEELLNSIKDCLK